MESRWLQGCCFYISKCWCQVDNFMYEYGTQAKAGNTYLAVLTTEMESKLHKW